MSGPTIERSRFEAWKNSRIRDPRMKGLGLDRSSEPGREDEYSDSQTQAQWVAWQAAMQTAAAVLADEVVPFELSPGGFRPEVDVEHICWAERQRVRRMLLDREVTA